MNWILKNKEWIFSGIGVLAVSAFIPIVIHVYRKVRGRWKAEVHETLSAPEYQYYTPLPFPSIPQHTILTKPTPDEIRAQVDSLPPFQQEGAATSYEGVKVCWQALFVDMEKEFSLGPYAGCWAIRLKYYNPAKYSSSKIMCRGVDLQANPILKSTHGNTPLIVQGTVENAYVRVDLKDVTIEVLHPEPMAQATPSAEATIRPPEVSHKISHKWTRGELWTAGGVIVAFMAIMASFFVPEVRRKIGLDKPSAIESKTIPPSPDKSTSLAATPSSTKVRPPSPTVSTLKKTKTPKVGIEQHGTGNAVAGWISAGPCSNIQIGGNNNQAVGGNCGPPLPKVSWSVLNKPPLKEAKHPEVWVDISINRTFLDPNFAVICDRPCTAVAGLFTWKGSGGGEFGEHWGPLDNRPNVAAFFVEQPNPMPSNILLDACVESTDDKPISVVNVTGLVIDPTQ